MKKQVAIALFTGLAFAACGGDDGNMGDDDDDVDAAVEPDAPDGGGTIRVNEDISANTTWVKENTYILPRLKYVFVKNGATLTIEPGTKILGEQGSVLVVTRGSKLEAAGTAATPTDVIRASAQIRNCVANESCRP